VNRPRSILGLTALTVGTLSVVSAIRATESPKVDAKKDTIIGPSSGLRVSPSFFLQNGENLSYSAVTESSTGESSESELNRQLTNPVTSSPRASCSSDAESLRCDRTGASELHACDFSAELEETVGGNLTRKGRVHETKGEVVESN
jgi:hypothetical protein